ncbi:MAG: presqualene diphosphate synthase HpnD [Verrucomicrobiota bacterium]
MQESQNITRKSASNLALAFILLPRPKREAMAALYAFCREVDDVADEETVPIEKRRAQLNLWREDIRLACEGGRPEFIVNRELQPVIQKYDLRFEHFDDLIRGVEMDFDYKRYETFDELEKYCYRVASVVGLLSIQIFGYQNPACRDYAVYLGKALQLTNILRDVKTDAALGRIYLPTVEMEKFHIAPEEILQGEYSENYFLLAQSVAARARHFYQLAQQTLPREDRKAMIAAELMGSVYWRLFKKLERQKFNVFGPRLTRLNKPQKISLVLRSWFRFMLGISTPNYGTC